MPKASGMVLDWYPQYAAQHIHTDARTRFIEKLSPAERKQYPTAISARSHRAGGILNAERHGGKPRGRAERSAVTRRQGGADPRAHQRQSITQRRSAAPAAPVVRVTPVARAPALLPSTHTRIRTRTLPSRSFLPAWKDAPRA